MKRVIYVTMFVSMLFVSAATKAQIKFGVKGGVNISSVKLNKDIVSSDNITGFHVGPMIEAMIPAMGLGLDAAVLYSQKGIDLNDDNWESMTTDYIDVPVNLKWKFGLPVLKGYLAAGPYVGFRVGGDKLWEMPGSIKNQVKAKSFGAGINLGAGVEIISHLQVGFNYGIGITDNYEVYRQGESTNAKTRTWSISAAILF